MHVWPSGRSEVSARGRWSATNVWFKSARLRASGVGGQAISKEFYLSFTLDLIESQSLASLAEISTGHDQGWKQKNQGQKMPWHGPWLIPQIHSTGRPARDWNEFPCIFLPVASKDLVFEMHYIKKKKNSSTVCCF